MLIRCLEVRGKRLENSSKIVGKAQIAIVKRQAKNKVTTEHAIRES